MEQVHELRKKLNALHNDLYHTLTSLLDAEHDMRRQVAALDRMLSTQGTPPSRPRQVEASVKSSPTKTSWGHRVVPTQLRQWVRTTNLLLFLLILMTG